MSYVAFRVSLGKIERLRDGKLTLESYIGIQTDQFWGAATTHGAYSRRRAGHSHAGYSRARAPEQTFETNKKVNFCELHRLPTALPRGFSLNTHDLDPGRCHKFQLQNSQGSGSLLSSDGANFCIADRAFTAAAGTPSPAQQKFLVKRKPHETKFIN